MISMPSRLTASETELKQRQNILNQITKENPIKDYQGIKMNHKG